MHARRELNRGFAAVFDRFEDTDFACEKNVFACHPHFLLRSPKQPHIEFAPK
ncbi:hypothetical protein [Erythrobacter sp.]|jgi:hypothetical protein|uniref:hypothetical protein n=1 Tax=Erythrobacter sp. TaxID=1042 RepID=UPI002EBBCCA7|nr:hypothetical protein [Erythrobacter sp.]